MTHIPSHDPTPLDGIKLLHRTKSLKKLHSIIKVPQIPMEDPSCGSDTQSQDYSQKKDEQDERSS